MKEKFIFAQEVNWGWLGSLAVGMGAAIDGNKLEDVKGIRDEISQKIDQISELIINNQQVKDLQVEPPILQWLYLLMGNIGWRWESVKNGVWNQLKDKPYKNKRE